MPENFAYKVRDAGGALLTGEIAGDSRELVLERLREKGYVPLEVKQKSVGLKKEFSFRPGRVKPKDMAVFFRQFATMINSGLPLLRALAILEEQTDSNELKKVLSEVRLDVEKGSSLSQSMARHPKTFSKLLVAMTKAGETGGALDSVLLRLADNLEAEVQLRQKVKSALTYPVAVFGLVVIILVAMLTFVVPTFKSLYDDLGGTLPVPTQILIVASNIMKKYFLVVFAVLIGAYIGYRRWKKTDNGRRTVDKIKLKVPIFGVLFHKTAMARFSRTLGVLSRSGVPILQAMDIVQDTVGNMVVAEALADVQASVKEGESLAKPLGRHAIFPPMVVQMLAVGEETGALDTMLTKIAEFYDEEISASVDALTSLIEPVLVGSVGGTVGAIVISLYLPLFRIIEIIK